MKVDIDMTALLNDLTEIWEEISFDTEKAELLLKNLIDELVIIQKRGN